jgi:hypothetical protein
VSSRGLEARNGLRTDETMHDGVDNNQQPGEPSSGLSREACAAELEKIGVLLRCAADDELTPEQRDRLDAFLAEHPEARNCIERERTLRERCGKLMGADGCPDALRAKIQALAANAQSPTPEPVAHEPHSFQDHARERSDHRRRRAGPLRAFAAMAAVLAVAATAMYFALPSTPGRGGADPMGRAQLVSTFVAREHKRCFLESTEVAGKFTVSEAGAVPAAFEKITGRTVDLSKLMLAGRCGLRFVDAGRCGVPGDEPAMHLRFEHADESRAVVSLFIQPATDWLTLKDGSPLTEGQTYKLQPNDERDAFAGKLLLCWMRDGLVHYLVADDPEMGDAFREELGLPEPADII